MTDTNFGLIISGATAITLVILGGIISYLLQAQKNEIKDISIKIDGRMDELLTVSKGLSEALGHSKGLIQGKADEKADQKERDDNIK
jgi:hypothetical protein